MRALPKNLREALRTLSAGPTWTITMVDDYYVKATKLAALGLVDFKPRFVRRGKYAGSRNGFDVVVTEKGLLALAEG